MPFRNGALSINHERDASIGFRKWQGMYVLLGIYGKMKRQKRKKSSKVEHTLKRERSGE